jgi:hypothetical protein
MAGFHLMSVTRHLGYTIEAVYQNITKNLRNEVIVFWLEYGALPDINTALERVDQIACVVRSATGDVVGISTVYPAPHGPGSEPYLNMRMFIQPAHRVPGLMKKLTLATRCFFDSNCEARGGARGMLIYAENPKLMRPGARRQFEQSVWEYAGKDQRGVDIWKFTFNS